jgi:hypothetical protein
MTDLAEQNRRLLDEIAKLKVEIADLSYAKLAPAEPERPATQDTPSAASLLTTFGALLDSPHSAPVVATILDLAQQDADMARAFGEFCVKRTPNQPALHMRWVRQLRYPKQFDLAIALCNAAFGADGDSAEIRLNRGYLFYEAGHYESAADDLDTAANGRPNSIEERLVASSARGRAGGQGADQQALLRSYFNPDSATFSAQNLDPDAVKQSLARYGCAWIQGLFDPAALTAFDAVIGKNLEGIQGVFKRLSLPPNFGTVGFPLYFAEEPPEKAHQTYERTYPALFDPNKMDGVGNKQLPKFVFDNLQRTGLAAIIRNYLRMEHLYVSAAACHIRSMVPEGFKSFGEFHQDNRLYNSDAEILTLWFPFRYQHGPMRSLEFLPVRSDSHFPCVSVCGIDNGMFDPAIFWRPEYKLGDAVLLSGFSPHRTYFEEHMTLERTSIDFRIFASPLPCPIYENGTPITTTIREPTRSLARRVANRLRRWSH